MPRNHTIVSTTEPVAIKAFLRTPEAEPGMVPDMYVDFDVAGMTIATRPILSSREIRVIEDLLREPVYLHMMAVEEDDLTLRGVLFITFPEEGRSEPWVPSALFTSPESHRDSPRCFPLGEVDLDGDIREKNPDFLRDAKAVLYALSGANVSDATERAIDNLLASVATIA